MDKKRSILHSSVYNEAVWKDKTKCPCVYVGPSTVQWVCCIQICRQSIYLTNEIFIEACLNKKSIYITYLHYDLNLDLYTFVALFVNSIVYDVFVPRYIAFKKKLTAICPVNQYVTKYIIHLTFLLHIYIAFVCRIYIYFLVIHFGLFTLNSIT